MKKLVLATIISLFTLVSTAWSNPVEIGDKLEFLKAGNLVTLFEIEGTGFSDNYGFQDLLFGRTTNNNESYELTDLASVDLSTMTILHPDVSINYTLFNGAITTNDFIYNFSWIGRFNIVDNCIAFAEIFDITPTNVQPVPEPTTSALFALGIAGFAAVGRRKKQ